MCARCKDARSVLDNESADIDPLGGMGRAQRWMGNGGVVECFASAHRSTKVYSTVVENRDSMGSPG